MFFFGELAVRLLVRLQRSGGTRTADDPEVPVHLVRRRELPDERSVVGRVQRREHALGDVAADRAEVGDHACSRRPAEAVVVHHDRGFPPTELLVGDLSDARVPLGAVAVVAEEVLRGDLHRRVLRPGRADDERLRRMPGPSRPSRVHRLVTRQRSDHDVGVQLLHQALRLGDGHRHGVVAAAVADDLDRRGADMDAGHAGRRLRVALGDTVGDRANASAHRRCLRRSRTRRRPCSRS